MERINIIGIDMVLLDEETGEYEFKAMVDKEFIKTFNIDTETLQDGLNNFIENYIKEVD